MVGGTAYYAGKKVQQGREQDDMTEARLEQLEAQQAYASSPEPAPSGGVSDATIQQLKQLAELKESGILTPDEFEQQKQKLLRGT